MANKFTSQIQSNLEEQLFSIMWIILRERLLQSIYPLTFYKPGDPILPIRLWIHNYTSTFPSQINPHHV